MAARAPTTFDMTVDEGALTARKQIITTAPSLVTTNQQQIADRNSMICNSTFFPIEITATTKTEFARFYISYDMLGRGFVSGTSTELHVAYYAWAPTDLTEFRIGLEFQTTGDWAFVNVTAGLTPSDVKWRDSQVTKEADCQGAEEEVRLYGHVTNAIDKFYVAGFAAWAEGP